MIREHTARIRPPRALWVPFDLGRPVGAPGNAAFQQRALRAALDLLERPSGPVLEDFPDDEPAGSSADLPLACPVSFAVDDPQLDDEEALLAAFHAEVDGLRNWYDVAVAQRGRTTANSTGTAPEAVAAFIADVARGGEPAHTIPETSWDMAVKMASEDLKAYYHEAVSAQPGRATDATSLGNWFWGDTVAAKVLNHIRLRCLASEQRAYQLLGKLLLVPRTQLHRFQEESGRVG